MTQPDGMILGGLGDPVHDSQRCFRGILDAMSRPARPVTLASPPDAPPGVAPATMAVLHCLLDQDTPLWLDPGLQARAARHISFHTQAPLVAEMSAASFILVGDGLQLPDLSCLPLGDPAYPERGATLLVQVGDLASGGALRFRGPGIDGTADLQIDGLAPEFWPAFAVNTELFPLGFDTILFAGTRIVGLPRTTLLEEA
ncbi:alpha-D-ribose 1-methylphosphonate 5-triphosphate synthase subunit PhnH [Dongia mobilis]|uniref:Alpha-D-ribose 1-methylphosphonate 5-triphosphate synthase subunit PhnH n=1 Tax=Dongia mobilis TaxID=578943 RepID=A0A4R6WWS5_9PROT|nr:phosphonate C-P lyase system protein PhnH [Dongia mobilis]TDQ84137.1 alpha-D-ribose 1-methylphosphonate 5-triphosphate synthase subunit PhnH [Dongia mobilis]